MSTIMIGDTINAFVQGLFVACMVFPLLFSFMRRSALPVWSVLTISVIMQIISFWLLNSPIQIDREDAVGEIGAGEGPITCGAPPVFSLGEDAMSFQLGSAQCLSASHVRGALAAAMLLVAYVLYVVATRSSFRRRHWDAKPAKWPIVAWSILLLIVALAIVTMWFILPAILNG